MRTDVADMKAFYESQLGKVAARQLARCVAELWPNLKGETVVGLGYPPPVLEPILAEAGAERVLALMPAEQGAWAWPNAEGVLTALMQDGQIPLADRAADRIVLLHSLEDAADIRPFLRDIWRVLTDSGRLLVIAANRRGLWSNADATPFGSGRPYSLTQLRLTLEAATFAVDQEMHALYAPPSRRALALWSADAAERFGRRWLSALGGVVAVDARKSLYGAAATSGARAARSANGLVGAPADVGKASAPGSVRRQ